MRALCSVVNSFLDVILVTAVCVTSLINMPFEIAQGEFKCYSQPPRSIENPTNLMSETGVTQAVMRVISIIFLTN